jgi:mannose-6-phosphate isomerase-like protein (cupin superfamily)
MIRIKMLKTGEVTLVDKNEAHRLISLGEASLVKRSPTRMVKHPNKMMMPRKKKGYRTK